MYGFSVSRNRTGVLLEVKFAIGNTGGESGQLAGSPNEF